MSRPGTSGWLANWDEAGRRRRDRLAGRPVAGTFTLHEAGTGRVSAPIPFDADPDEWPEGWEPTNVDRSVHMRPAETPHPTVVERARTAIADRVDTAVARSVRWLLNRSGVGR